MKAPIIPIGNSKGIRLPKTIIELCGFKEEVVLEVYSDTLIIRSAEAPKKPLPPHIRDGHPAPHKKPSKKKPHKHGSKHHHDAHHHDEGSRARPLPSPDYDDVIEHKPSRRDPIYSVLDADEEDWD